MVKPCGLGDQEISKSEGEFKDVIAPPVFIIGKMPRAWITPSRVYWNLP
jgi:hypothetical protein